MLKIIFVPLRLGLISISISMLCVAPAVSQTSPGQNWSSGWGFRSANDRSVGYQRANTIRLAQQAPGPSTVVNNVYNNDNRSNYVDVNSGGPVTTDFQIGDDIGQNTNSVGSMNTGSTTIEVNGSGNDLNAINSADNSGCVDGSALTSTFSVPQTTETLGLAPSTPGAGLTGSSSSPSGFQIGNIASPFNDCIK